MAVPAAVGATAEDVLARHRVMWGPTIGIGRTPFELVDGAAASGYDHVSLVAQDLRDLGDEGLQRLEEHLAETGVRVAFIDGFYTWQPLDGTKLDGAMCPLTQILELAERFDARFIGALAVPLGFALDDLAGRFAEPSATVGAAGRVLTLEFSPLGGVTDLAAADAVIAPSGYASAGILFDTWHFFRSTADFDLLATLSGEQIVTVQISDAAAEIQESLWKDTIRHRRQPGDGSFDLPRVVSMLEAIGALDWYGPEVISSAHQAMSPSEAGRVSGERLDAFLAALFPA